VWQLDGPVIHAVCMNCYPLGTEFPLPAVCGVAIERRQPRDWPRCASCSTFQACLVCGAVFVGKIDY